MQGGFMKEKDFKESQVNEVTEFLDAAFVFPYMLRLSETAVECSDLSELWFKEFYLELTKEIQFPIDMSLPWILASTILESEDPAAIEFVDHSLPDDIILYLD